ncbi:uncharacterized protein [Ptychodera flava]|uniref:uncharacterized protein n=1 Tax=Ptychodera flava TaxID=63121 RepID=UPI003969DA0B
MPRGGHHCCVVGCTSNSKWSKEKRRFFRIPSAKTRSELRQKWLQLIKRAPPFSVSDNTRVCDLHFLDGAPSKSNPLPMLKMGHDIKVTHERRPIIRSSLPPPVKKRKRHANSEDKSCIEKPKPCMDDADNRDTISSDIIFQTDKRMHGFIEDHDYFVNNHGPSTKNTLAEDLEMSKLGDNSGILHKKSTPLLNSLSSEQEDLQSVIKKLITKIKIMKNKIDKLQYLQTQKQKFSINEISHNDKKILFYTGLTSYKAFNVVFEKFMKKRAAKLSTNTRSSRKPWYMKGKKPGPMRKLSLKDEFLLVLMKLRLGLLDEDLADRFRISTSLTRLLINRWIPLMARCLKKLIAWPSKDKVAACLPKQFKATYPATRVIIDCTEIFIERPSNIVARQQTYSNYKHHNTAKFLVGISPTGGISTLSQVWGGRASDRHIVEQSETEFMDKLEYGDQVMADRGFDIGDLLALRGCTLNIPPFTRGKTQLSQKEIERGRQISYLRIHVERAIERIKRFRILQGVFPLKRIHLLNDIITVCAAITNLLPPLVVDQVQSELEYC